MINLMFSGVQDGKSNPQGAAGVSRCSGRCTTCSSILLRGGCNQCDGQPRADWAGGACFHGAVLFFLHTMSRFSHTESKISMAVANAFNYRLWLWTMPMGEQLVYSPVFLLPASSSTSSTLLTRRYLSSASSCIQCERYLVQSCLFL